MARFTIPQSDGSRISRGVTDVADSSNTFGNQVEDVVAPVDPSAKAFGLETAQAEQAKGYAVADAGIDAGQQIERARKRAELLQQAEERTQAQLDIANTDAAWEETKVQISKDRYDLSYTAEEYQQALTDAKDEIGYNSSVQSKYKTKVGDDFNTALDFRLKRYNMEVIKEGGLVEDYRMERVRGNITNLQNVIRQNSAANGTYDAMMNARGELELLYNNGANVQAMGGIDNAEVNKLNAVNEIYTDQIHLALQNQDNLDSVHGLLTTKLEGNEQEFKYYPDLDPKVRSQMIRKAEAAKKLKKKLAKDKAWYTGVLEHGRQTGRIPSLADPRYNKMVNNEYDDTFLPSIAHLPANERYAATRTFIKETQTMPKNLKTELAMSYQSNDLFEVEGALKFASDLVRDNSRMSKELPDELVTASIMHQAGMTVENVVKTMEVTRNMSPQQKAALDDAWKDKDTREIALEARNDFTSDMGSVPALVGEYETLYKMNYMKTLGDAEAAKALTETALNRVWGITEIGSNERPMKYAPERLVSQAGEWMQEQLLEDAKSVGVDLQGKDFYLVPTEKTIKTGKPEYFVMVVDELTGLPNPITKDNVRQMFTFEYSATEEAKKMKVEKDYKYYNAIIQTEYKKSLDAWWNLPLKERWKTEKPKQPDELEAPVEPVESPKFKLNSFGAL